MSLALLDKKKTISMEFRSDEVRVVEGRYKKKNVTVEKCFTIPIASGLYEDGVIKDMDELSHVLQKGLTKNNISRGEVYGVINSSNIIIREIRIPKVDEKQIAAILNYQLDDYFPVNPDEYVVQHITLDVVEEDGVEKQNVMLVGVPKYIVESHLNLLQNAGLKPLVLDYTGNAISKLIRLNDTVNGIYDKNMTIASVDLEEEGTALNIMDKGLMSMSRVIKEELSPIVFKTYDESYDQEVAAVSSLRGNLSSVLEKIDMVFRYYNSRESENNIELVMIYGDYSYVDGIEELMTSYFDIPCVKLISLDKVKFFGDLAKYANAIGALIRVNGVK